MGMSEMLHSSKVRLVAVAIAVPLALTGCNMSGADESALPDSGAGTGTELPPADGATPDNRPVRHRVPAHE